MSYHVVNIDAPKVSITCRHGQLCCTDSSGNVRSLPMEDVASVVITSFSPVLHGEFLSRAAEFGIAVILCKNFQPVSILMPANRSSDTLLTKALHVSTKGVQKTFGKKPSMQNAQIRNLPQHCLWQIRAI